MTQSSRKTIRSRLLLVPLIVFMCLIPLLFIKPEISTDIQILLPRDKWISNHLDFLRNSQLGSVIALSIDLNKGNDSLQVIKISDDLAAKFARLPRIKSVFARIDSTKSIEMAAFLYQHLPIFFNQEDLELIDQRINLRRLNPIIKEHYGMVLRPGGMFRQKMIASDPLNLFQIPLTRLQTVGSNSGFKFEMHDSGLLSLDKRHLLMVLYTDIPVTDPENAEIQHLSIQKILSLTIPDNKYIIMAGHRHAIDNRHLLKHDIFITLTVAGIGFFLLFTLFFRDWRALFVFVVPIVGMICAVGLTLTIFESPSAIILGLGATVIGIALDYGIHVFVAAKHIGLERDNALRNIRRPLIFSALTTLGVFWAFFFSGTPGYHQLAFASTCGITLSLFFSLVCLPLLLPETKSEIISLGDCFIPVYSRRIAVKIFLIWIGLSILAVMTFSFTGFEPDVRKLDGISEELRKDEDEFRKIWGENSKAAISVTSQNLEEAMQTQDEISKFAKKEQISGFQSLALIWPSLKSRRENSQNWDKFWKSGKENELRKNLAEVGVKYNFSNTAFQPFFEKLYVHDLKIDLLKEPAFEMLKRKFINFEKDKFRVTSYFDDSPTAVDKFRKFLSNFENAEVISPKSFGSYISTRILSDAVHIALISICLVMVLAYLCLKKISKTTVALLPVISSILIIIPIFAIIGLKINAVALVACIVVTGLAIDYGIFVVSACDRDEKVFSKDALKALTLSVLSTAIGAAALLWAQHPALRTVGLVISSGVLSGYICAIFVSPALYQLICRKH